MDAGGYGAECAVGQGGGDMICDRTTFFMAIRWLDVMEKD